MPTTPFLVHSGGVPLAGRMHRAPGDDPRPAVVVTGSWLTVKEQMPDRYAAALAGLGRTALTFDFAGFGRSGGEPRQLESPTRKMADLAAVVAYAATIAPGPPAVLAVCASAQYALAAAAHGLPISALASVAGWFHDGPSLAPLYGGAEGVAARLARADAALERYLADGTVTTVKAYDPEDERAGMPMPLPYYAEADRGAVPEWRNEMAEMSWRPWLTSDGVAPAAAVTVPTLFVHADGCVLPDNVRRVAAAMGDLATVAWSDGEQTDFYDRPARVDAAVAAADASLPGGDRMSALVDLVHAVDRLDWARVRAAFADELVLDYSSLSGGAAEQLAADELVARWQGLLPGFEATQHLLGPVATSDDGGRAEAHVRAWHRLGGQEWVVAGHYVAELSGGRITALTLETYYQDGVPDLAERAAARVAAGTTR